MSPRWTLIAVSADSPVTRSTVPLPRGGVPTVAVVQYELLVGAPHVLTQDDVLFLSWLERQPDADRLTGPERTALRDEFFARPRACLRTSPLPKKYGFGLLLDEHERVALCPVESAEYRRLVGGEGPARVVRAMRTRRPSRG
ncbi:DUF6157 family protein [Wenjunlia vitaminophila]|uniref:DUF6157 family protein n=1 Tax=Wenjunlia vitaminophila TaxID=76728 RepID=UPI0003A86F9A|nr:DUF6157 family protein [Wenjunlia vitaminophila]